MVGEVLILEKKLSVTHASVISVENALYLKTSYSNDVISY